MKKQPWCQRETVRRKTQFLGLLIALLFRTLELITDALFSIIYWKSPSQKLSPFEDLLLMDSATALAAKIRTRKVTSEQVVSAYISRIRAVNPLINCVVDESFEEALEKAREVDNELKRGLKDPKTLEIETPFLGVPFTTKDCFAVKGFRNTAGLVRRKDIVAENDADVVALVKKAGAIIIAVTNVSELCMWWESNNNIYGRSRNPYDLNRIVGGSSGGEGGILCAGGSPFGIGSDIGGSIRMPSFFNGIFGHKPSTGIVSNKGQQPIAEKILDTFLVSGPMSRFCCDLVPMYRVLAAGNVGKLKLDQKVDVSKLRYFYMEEIGNSPVISKVHPDMKAAQQKIVRHFEQAYKIKVQKVSFPKFFHSGEIWLSKMSSAGVYTFAEELAMREGSVSCGKELIKCLFGMSDHTPAALIMGLMESLALEADHPTTRQVAAMCDELLRELQELLGDDGVLFAPSHPTPALYHNQPIFKPLNAAYTAIFNVLGVPVSQVPLGLGSWGVPVGTQVIGSLYNDHLTLAVAAELERAFGGWVPPAPVLC